MKLLVSDYDYTFYLNDEDIIKNVEAVRKFIKNNIFLIATGRSYFHYNNVKKLHNIESNYVILNHGATIIKDDKIIYNIEIDNSIKDELIKDLKVNEIVDYYCCSKLENYNSLDIYDLTKIHVQYETEKEAQEVKKVILSKYSDYINCFFVCKKRAIEIVSKKVDKSKAIKYVANLEGIEEKDIYTIGDGYNDIEMIKKFNGARIINCVEELKQVTDVEYQSVSKMINDILDGKI